MLQRRVQAELRASPSVFPPSLRDVACTLEVFPSDAPDLRDKLRDSLSAGIPAVVRNLRRSVTILYKLS